MAGWTRDPWLCARAPWDPSVQLLGLLAVTEEAAVTNRCDGSRAGGLSSHCDRLQVSTPGWCFRAGCSTRTPCAGWAVFASSVLAGCTSVDPGPNFVVPETTFDPDYFYCHVEPEFIFKNSCGSGDPSKGDPPNGCHFNSSAVSGMALINHMAVDCGGGDHPVDATQTGTGSAAQGNYEAVSLEMSTDYTTAPLYVRPSGSNHPRQVFVPGDSTVTQILSTWASK